MAIVLSDSRSNPVDTINRFYKRDRGTAGFGDAVAWTDYGGASPVLTVRHNDASKYDLAILLQATSPTAAPTAANSVLLVQNSGASIGAGKTLSLYNAAGSNAAVLVHSATNDVLKTTGGFWATGAVNVGASLTATTAGDVLVEHALNVGTTATATGVGDGYLAGGVRVGTGTTGLATANGRITVGENVVLGVTGGQFRGVIAGSVTDNVLVIGTATDTTAGDEHFAITAAGTMAWGAGGAATRDAMLERTGAAAMQLTGTLTTTVGIRAATVLNVGAAASATDTGDGYMSGGLSLGTYVNPAAGELQAATITITGATSTVNGAPITRTYLQGVLSVAYSLTNSLADIGVSAQVTLPGLGQYLVTGTFFVIAAGAGDVGNEVYGALAVGAGATILNTGLLTICQLTAAGLRQTKTRSWLVNVTSGTPVAKLQAQRNAGTGTSTIGASFTDISAVYLGKP